MDDVLVFNNRSNRNRVVNADLNYVNSNNLEFNSHANPITILQEAFGTFIVNTAIESNTIGINVIYLENPNDTEPKNIIIAKENYNTPDNSRQRNFIMENTNESQYVSGEDINNSNIFENNQLNALLERLNNFQITNHGKMRTRGV